MNTNTSTSSYFRDIFKNIEDEKKWQSDIQFNINQVVNTDADHINLSEVLKSTNNYAFPSHFNGIDNKSRLIVAIRLSAMKSGFMVIQRKCKSEKQLNKHHLAYLTLQCQHGISFQRTRPSSSIRNSKPKNSIERIDLCPFRMNISLCKETNVWPLHCRKGSQKQCAEIHKIISRCTRNTYTRIYLFSLDVNSKY